MVHVNYHEVEGATPEACGRELGRLFGSAMRAYIREESKNVTWRRLKRDAEPLLLHTGRHFPEYVEELEAYADAAGLPLLDVWTLSVQDELDDDSEKCTTAITNDGRLICHNEDWDVDAEDDICILKRRCGNVTTLELYYYGCPLGGTALSICSQGYIQAINSLSHADWQVGVPKIAIARRLSELRDAGTELDALLAIRRSSGFAHNLVHYTGQILSVECTATRAIVRQPEAPFVHTNHVLHKALAGLEDDHDGRSTFTRYETACNLVRAKMNEAELKRLAGDQRRGRTQSIFNENTIARAIVDLDRRVASFWLKRESGKGWVDYPIDFLFATSEA